MVIRHHIGARVGLVGNPSDGFGGKTISALIEDFSATVTLWESPQLTIIPHPQFDPFCFGSLNELACVASLDGYYGGMRLLYATCNHFHSRCHKAGIHLPERNFTLEYDIDIPRQVGLAGSSAIITAAFRCLLDFYELNDRLMPKELLPTFVLGVEAEELHIQAGLQDRVVQIYGGLVYMDFTPEIVARQGHGHYEPMDLDLLPPLYLAYSDDPSDSGKIHSRARYRFDAGEPEVIAAMSQFAELTDQGREALESRDYSMLGKLMNANFDLRRKVYGDEWIGPRNLEMVATARRFGLPAKFSGSGGAVVGFYEDEHQFRDAEEAFYERGYRFRKITPTQMVVIPAKPHGTSNGFPGLVGLIANGAKV